MDQERTATTPTLDLFQLERYLTDKQASVRDAVRAYVQTAVLPNINPYWDRAEFPRDLAMGLRDLPIIGGVLRGYDCAALDPLERILRNFARSVATCRDR